MLVELWGVSGTVHLSLPDNPLEYLLFLFYVVLLFAALAYYRGHLGQLSLARWGWVLGLALSGLVASQLFPLRTPVFEQPVTLFTAVPLLFAAAMLNPVAALLVGAATGLGHALGQSHHWYDPFHFAFAGALAGLLIQQPYIGRFYQWLREPALSGPIALAIVAPLTGLAAFLPAWGQAGTLNALDQALYATNTSFWMLLLEGFVAGGVVTLILRQLPDLRPRYSLIPSPGQRSLRGRLLGNFLGFAVFLIVLLVTIVFNLSIAVSRQLVVNQMSHNARVVSAEIPEFQSRLQNQIAIFNDDYSLLSHNPGTAEQRLEQMFRSVPAYRHLILVDQDQEVTAFYPRDVEQITLSAAEKATVATVFVTNTPQIATPDLPDEEQVVSFVMPVLNQNATAGSALIGRVPQPAVNSLIVGLQGTVGQGVGFIVNEEDTIIAHPDARKVRDLWKPDPGGRAISTHGAGAESGAYQAYRSDSQTRELVYFLRAETHPWMVVITAPYAVVLDLGLRIGTPLLLVLLLVTGAVYFHLLFQSREITRPITEIVAASKSMAAGGDWTPSVHTQRDDEIGQLGQAFAQMQRSMKKRLNELSLLLAVSHDVSTSIDLTQGMPAILRGALRGTGASGARAVVVNPSGGNPLSFGEGPAAASMATLDRPIMTRLRHAPELMLATPNQIRAALDLEKTADLPVPALLAIPLHFHDRFQGILWLGYRQTHSFDLTERNLLHTLASQAAVLVENARLFATAEGGRRRLAAVLASTSDAVIVTDQTERLLLINPAAERIFGVKASQVISLPIADVLQSNPLVAALTGPEEHIPSLEVPTDDGLIFYASVSTIVSNEGQVFGRVAVLRDITHLKEIDQMKSDFVATVSHDLRSPLTFMRGYATMLPMVGEMSDKQQDYVDKILTGIDQMAQLVDDLLDLGRIEAGIDLEQQSVTVQSLLSDIAAEYWQHAHLAGVKLEVEVEPGVSVVRGDAGLLRQAVTNLVGNGIKYAPNSGVIKLRAASINGEIIISVKDNGPGIPEQDQIRLFEKFYRVKQPGTERIKGSGLGLAIVKSIAERHGGRVWCHSQQGKGSTFFISLPCQPASANGMSQS